MVEEAGIPTVCISTGRDLTAKVKPPLYNQYKYQSLCLTSYYPYEYCSKKRYYKFSTKVKLLEKARQEARVGEGLAAAAKVTAKVRPHLYHILMYCLINPFGRSVCQK